MTIHIAVGHPEIPCTMAAHGRCRICDLTERGGVHYSEAYRRLFHPGEFPVVASEPTQAPNPPRIIEPDPAPPAAMPSVPLAGDLVAALTAAIGVDRVMKWVAKKRGKSCNCPQRQAALNKMDAAGRRYLKRLGSGTTD